MMKTAILILSSCLGLATVAQEPIATKAEFTESLKTVGGELKIVDNKSVELNSRGILDYYPDQIEHEKGMFLLPLYNFGDTDVVFFWKVGSDRQSTGIVRVLTIRRDGTASVSRDYLGSGMLPVVTRSGRSLNISFPESVGLHGGGPAETWIWQNGKLTKIRTNRRAQ